MRMTFFLLVTTLVRCSLHAISDLMLVESSLSTMSTKMNTVCTHESRHFDHFFWKPSSQHHVNAFLPLTDTQNGTPGAVHTNRQSARACPVMRRAVRLLCSSPRRCCLMRCWGWRASSAAASRSKRIQRRAWSSTPTPACGATTRARAPPSGVRRPKPRHRRGTRRPPRGPACQRPTTIAPRPARSQRRPSRRRRPRRRSQRQARGRRREPLRCARPGTQRADPPPSTRGLAGLRSPLSLGAPFPRGLCSST